MPISTAFAQNRYVRCIGTGSQNLMAIIMIGAVFNLLNSIQIAPYQSFIQATGIAAFLNAVYNACMNFMGVFMVFSVGYAGAKIFDHDELAFNNGLMSLVAYLIMVPVATNEVEQQRRRPGLSGQPRCLPGIHPGHHGHQDQYRPGGAEHHH